MTDTVTFNVANGNKSTRKFTFQTESKELINSIITVGSDNTISHSDMVKLQETARKNGDAGILEQCDLSAEEKLKMAELNGYNGPYELSLSEDKKFLKVKVKKTKWYYPDPQLRTIKADFGIEAKVLVTKDGIPYGNEGVISKRAEPGSSADGRNTDYDVAELKAGDVINLPIALVKLNSKPQGFWQRPWF